MFAFLSVFYILVIAPQVTSKLSLVVVGDWGGDSDEEPTTAAQIADSNGMATVAHNLDAEGVLLLGDNFYTHGVDSVDSVRFNITFEQVYPPASFQELPFYVIAGNHDHRGNVEAQIDYHSRSTRWHFPQLYYTLNFNFTSTSGVLRTVDLIMIDTVDLAGACIDEYPGCPLVQSLEDIQAAETQWTWLDEQLNKSTADFLWVAGHFPIYSAGSDGTTDILVERLLPKLQSVGAHYISGHDHMHEHILSDNVHMFVTGPGRMCCYDIPNLHTVPNGTIQFMISGENATGVNIGPKPTSPVIAGFSSMEFDDTVDFKMYNQDGALLWNPPSIAPRVLHKEKKVKK